MILLDTPSSRLCKKMVGQAIYLGLPQVGETLVKGMEDVEVGGIAGKKMPPGVQLDERSKAGGESCPDVLEGGTRVVVQVPKDETSQVAQEGAQVELKYLG